MRMQKYSFQFVIHNSNYKIVDWQNFKFYNLQNFQVSKTITRNTKPETFQLLFSIFVVLKSFQIKYLWVVSENG